MWIVAAFAAPPLPPPPPPGAELPTLDGEVATVAEVQACIAAQRCPDEAVEADAAGAARVSRRLATAWCASRGDRLVDPADLTSWHQGERGLNTGFGSTGAEWASGGRVTDGASGVRDAARGERALVRCLGTVTVADRPGGRDEVPCDPTEGPLAVPTDGPWSCGGLPFEVRFPVDQVTRTVAGGGAVALLGTGDGGALLVAWRMNPHPTAAALDGLIAELLRQASPAGPQAPAAPVDLALPGATFAREATFAYAFGPRQVPARGAVRAAAIGGYDVTWLVGGAAGGGFDPTGEAGRRFLESVRPRRPPVQRVDLPGGAWLLLPRDASRLGPVADRPFRGTWVWPSEGLGFALQVVPLDAAAKGCAFTREALSQAIGPVTRFEPRALEGHPGVRVEGTVNGNLYAAWIVCTEDDGFSLSLHPFGGGALPGDPEAVLRRLGAGLVLPDAGVSRP